MQVPLFPSLCAFSALLVASTPCAQVAYTWEDEKGVIHFSDTPTPGANTITLPDLEATPPAPKVQSTDTPAQPVASTQPPAKTPPPESEQPQPLSLTMITPQHNATLRSNLGLITIKLDVSRKLGVGEQLQLFLDGKPYGAPQPQPAWHLKNIDRGSHTLAAQAKRSGKVIASTSPITVHLHRAKIKAGENQPKQDK
ncbi:DUF4124 domain-containing protein [Vibrio sp. CAU 1672]|uniref:DUF4124 domain-containing protein n=1 Tax=Vibrio sp. CAU 1672 TaxID=3032594 RepID=UPI0023DC5B66|nr:DUF4124 domain-containing protein [Vibrio sp. CAU 1672]MDF2154009.1 DUF4124 domain-containing protein [Vibrio sp. CAU 1672]